MISKFKFEVYIIYISIQHLVHLPPLMLASLPLHGMGWDQGLQTHPIYRFGSDILYQPIPHIMTRIMTRILSIWLHVASNMAPLEPSNVAPKSSLYIADGTAKSC